MANLNDIGCKSKQVNTGRGTCGPRKAPNIYSLFVPKGRHFTAADIADFKATLAALLVNNDPLLRAFAIGRYSSEENTGQDENVENFDDGTSAITRDPSDMLMRTITDGNLCTLKNILSFDQTQDRFDEYWIDKNGIIYGLAASNDTTFAFEIAGFTPYMISAKRMDPVTFSASARYRIAMAYVDPKADQKNWAYIDCSNLNLPQLFQTNAVQNVILQEKAPSTVAGTHTVFVNGSCGTQPLTDLYPTLLNVAARYKMTRLDTNANVVITSATINADKSVTLIMTTPPPAGTKVALETAGVTDWAGVGMKYYESNRIILTIAA